MAKAYFVYQIGPKLTSISWTVRGIENKCLNIWPISPLDLSSPRFNSEDCLIIPSRKRKLETVILTRSKKRRLTFNKIQIDMLTRLPHIGEKIFNSLDNPSLLKCKEVSKTWYDFIDDQKFPWVRMIKTYVKESNKTYTECPKYWHQLFRRSSTEQLMKFAGEIRRDVGSIAYKAQF